MRHAVRLAVAFAVCMAGLSAAAPARLNAASNPLDTPTTMVRFYFHALDTHQCDLAAKFAGGNGQTLSAFRRNCRAIRRIVIEQLDDPGYRLRPQNAAYTCLAIRYSVYRDSGTQSFGGWYLMERTLGPAWSILFAGSRITRGGRAMQLTRPQCACPHPSRIGLAGDKEDLTFKDAHDGWLTAIEATGVPDLYHTADGDLTWQWQAIDVGQQLG